MPAQASKDLFLSAIAQGLKPNETTAAAPVGDYHDWLARYFAAYTTARNAPRHDRFWDWIEALQPGTRPRARVEVWPRGGGKSTTIELGCARLGSEPDPRRHYVLYVCKIQDQADKHVQAIAAMLEKIGVGRAVNEYGSSKGWRHSEIRTNTGFNVTAFGLDAGMRGVKLDEFRPDVIIFDDVDDRLDTIDAINKKIAVITTTILPSGSTDCAIIFVQNKIAKDSIISQLCDGRADFLYSRLPPTVEPAVVDLAYERVFDDDGMPHYAITAGTPTWAGQNLETCTQQMNDWGLSAFLREAQHKVDEVEDGLWERGRDIDAFRVTTHPELVRIVIGIDPSATTSGDEAGIVAAGLGRNGHGYLLADRSVRGSPKTWAEAGVSLYNILKADKMVAESNNGGEMVSLTIGTIPNAPSVKLIHASRGKLTRAEPVQKLAQDGRIHHVGRFPELEGELVTWKPGMESPNRLDAYVWTFTELMVAAGPSKTLRSRPGL